MPARDDVVMKIKVEDDKSTPGAAPERPSPRPGTALGAPPQSAMDLAFGHLPGLMAAIEKARAQVAGPKDARVLPYGPDVAAPPVRRAPPQSSAGREEAAQTGAGIGAGIKDAVSKMGGAGSIVQGLIGGAGNIAASGYSNVGMGGGAIGAAFAGLEKLGEQIPILNTALGTFKATVTALDKVERERARGIMHFSDTVSSVLAGDVAGARIKRLEKTIEDREKYMGIIGTAINWWTGAHSKLAGQQMVMQTRQGIMGEAARLGQYSPEIAGAQARAEMVKVAADLRAARAHGASLAANVKTTAEVDAAMQAALVPVKEEIYRRFEKATAAGDSEQLLKIAEALQDQSKLFEYLKANGELSANLQKRIAEELKKIREGADFGGAGQDFFQKLLDGAELLKGVPQGDDVIGDAAREGMMRPLE